MALQLTINGKPRTLETLQPGSALNELVEQLELRSDRIAVEQNGQIVARTQWQQASLAEGDRIEVVHFVGGGAA